MSQINISNLTFGYDGSIDDVFTDVVATKSVELQV